MTAAKKYRGVWNTVDVTIVVRVQVECHPDDAEREAEREALAELDDRAWGQKAVGSVLVETEVSP